ncbi:MAG: sel1 repeat family protein [Candidatus Scalindua sp.]|nr:sel1 repeat family protein [Candidatus Scalindua sp.]
MNRLKKICFVLLVTMFLSSCSTTSLISSTPSSVYGGSCFGKPGDFDDCLIKAKQGDARAQYALGWIYRGNKDIPNDVTEDYEESVKWYGKAAEQGHAKSQTWLGVMYSLGWGVTQGYKETINWYRKAADQNETLAQLRLGSHYFNGRGVPKDVNEAEKWFRRTVANGDARNQYNLGWRYAEGRSVAQDYKEALVWYRKSANQGYALAQYHLALSYKKGNGTKQDNVKAYAWMLVAAESDKSYREGKDSYALNLTSSQRQESMEIAQEIHESINKTEM